MARGLQNFAGGSFSGDAIVGLTDTDPLQGAITALTAAADAINPHLSGNYIVTRAGVDAMTLAAPTAGVDDGLVIVIQSSTAFAHTLTATALLKTGSANVNVATFAAFSGANVQLRAFNGLWLVMGQIGITFS